MAETSMDSVVWEKEARYNYYLHGPLARATLGDQLVQGIDYAYTLQGWLKGVNADNLSNADYDMGNDGKVSASNQYVARDAMGFNLNYFSTDYNPIKSTTLTAFPDVSSSITGYRPLYNGNINSMAVNINFPSPTTAQVPQLYAYSYDQLNRLTGMDVYRSPGISNSSNTWGATAQTPVGDYKERVAYDANGNILKYLRQGFGTLLPMDSLSYNYTYNSGKLVNNKLNYVTDKISGSTAHSTNYTEDIDDQAAGNYTYDQIGNLIADAKEGITNVLWNVYGKIKQVQRTATAANPVTRIAYSYDAGGNRISKQVNKSATDSIEYTWYVRDASGNIMSTYLAKGAPNGTVTSAATTLMLTEQNLFGSSRIGVANRNIYVHNTFTIGNVVNFIRGKKFFELSNHLGNVLVTVSDKKIGHDAGNGTIDYYTADIVTAQNYTPFGMQMVGRKYSQANAKYRYGFNGKENDNEVKGEGNQQDYGMRIYDPRLGRFLSVDPITNKYPELTPYQFASNRPIDGIDQDGLEYLENLKSRQNTYFNAVRDIQLKPPSRKESDILIPDLFGNGVIAPKSHAEAIVAIRRQNYYNAVADNIAGGPGGAFGYMAGGNKGSFVGASIDGIALSFGGIPGESSVFPKSYKVASNVLTPTEITPLVTTPINISIKLKSTWNTEQIAEAYNKGQAISNNPEAKVMIKNPLPRLANTKTNYLKQGGVLTKGQQVDHTTDLQLNGNNGADGKTNLGALNGSVNASFGAQIFQQIKNVQDGTRVSHVTIDPFTPHK